MDSRNMAIGLVPCHCKGSMVSRHVRRRHTRIASPRALRPHTLVRCSILCVFEFQWCNCGDGIQAHKHIKFRRRLVGMKVKQRCEKTMLGWIWDGIQFKKTSSSREGWRWDES